uniref:Uncharacterized protein n=1 Tax=Avena sativa TaxID=4498 RepID=A0ACD5XB13_AVESA
MAGEEDGEAWAQADMSAMRRRLLSLIHRHYLEAISRLPAADLRATLARGLLVAGHCYGPLHPVHNIILSSIWYAASFPLRDADRIDAHMISNDGIVRACHRSLDGLVASLRHFCPQLSTGDALWNLMSAQADLSAAVALANRTSRSSAQRAMGLQAHGAFQVAANAALHPNPAAFVLFSSSVLPTVERDTVLFLRTTHMLSPMDIRRLEKSLVPNFPNDLLQPSLVTSPGVLEWHCASTHCNPRNSLLFILCDLLKIERLDNCYHINFFAHRQESGSVLGTRLLFFTEALVPAIDDSSIRLCVIVDPLREIGSCFACETNKKKIVHPTYYEYLGGRDFQVDDVDNGDFPNPLDVDYIFFDAERDIVFANHLDDIISCDKGGSTDVLETARPCSDVDICILTGRFDDASL